MPQIRSNVPVSFSSRPSHEDPDHASMLSRRAMQLCHLDLLKLRVRPGHHAELAASPAPCELHALQGLGLDLLRDLGIVIGAVAELQLAVEARCVRLALLVDEEGVAPRAGDICSLADAGHGGGLEQDTGAVVLVPADGLWVLELLLRELEPEVSTVYPAPDKEAPIGGDSRRVLLSTDQGNNALLGQGADLQWVREDGIVAACVLGVARLAVAVQAPGKESVQLVHCEGVVGAGTNELEWVSAQFKDVRVVGLAVIASNACPAADLVLLVDTPGPHFALDIEGESMVRPADDLGDVLETRYKRWLVLYLYALILVEEKCLVGLTILLSQLRVSSCSHDTNQ